MDYVIIKVIPVHVKISLSIYNHINIEEILRLIYYEQVKKNEKIQICTCYLD